MQSCESLPERLGPEWRVGGHTHPVYRPVCVRFDSLTLLDEDGESLHSWENVEPIVTTTWLGHLYVRVDLLAAPPVGSGARDCRIRAGSIDMVVQIREMQIGPGRITLFI